MAKHTERSPKGKINAVGEVREVALKADGGGSFKLLLENGDTLTATFTEREEMIVTNALRLHNNVWLKVKGPGTFDDAGKLKHILRLEHCQQVPAPASHDKGDSPQEDSDSQDGGENSSLSPGQSILKIFEKIHKSSPEGTWDDMPTDLAENWHYYKYGRKRRKARD